MPKSDKEKREMQERSEKDFGHWLDEANIAWVYINQNPGDLFSGRLADKGRRPDFLVALPNLGVIAVDIKCESTYRNYHHFGVNKETCQQYLGFRHEFNVPVWYAFNDIEQQKTWYWIPVDDASRFPLKSERNDGSSLETPFYQIGKEDCVKVGQADDLVKLIGYLIQNLREQKNEKNEEDGTSKADRII